MRVPAVPPVVNNQEVARLAVQVDEPAAVVDEPAVVVDEPVVVA